MLQRNILDNIEIRIVQRVGRYFYLWSCMVVHIAPIHQDFDAAWSSRPYVCEGIKPISRLFLSMFIPILFVSSVNWWKRFWDILINLTFSSSTHFCHFTPKQEEWYTLLLLSSISFPFPLIPFISFLSKLANRA